MRNWMVVIYEEGSPDDRTVSIFDNLPDAASHFSSAVDGGKEAYLARVIAQSWED